MNSKTTIIIFLALVHGASDSIAQERQLPPAGSPATGFEPYVLSNRLEANNRWLVSWMRQASGGFEIAWSESSNLGDDWDVAKGLGSTRKDPLLAMYRDPVENKSAFYLGYFTTTFTGCEAKVRRYVPGNPLDAEGATLASACDRPWMVTGANRAVLAYAGGQVPPTLGARGGTINTDSTSADFCKIDWASSTTTVVTAASGLEFVPHPLIAPGSTVSGSTYFHYIGLQINSSNFTDTNIKFRYLRSADGGATWTEKTGTGGFNVQMNDGPDGYHWHRDRPMTLILRRIPWVVGHAESLRQDAVHLVC